MSGASGDELARLAPRHREKLRASAIAPAVAEARGYRSAASKAELRRLGFSDTQCRVPALVIPVWDVFGEVANYQIRPDEPRIGDRGKPVKYELPRGSTMLLDAHPALKARLADPSVPLWITEGIPKSDAAVSAGLCCLALLGVWNWRGTNGLGGKTALPEWEAIAVNGRRVYLAFDSDAMTKPGVYFALERLGAFLARRGADVAYVYLPAGPGGAKTGLDDSLARGGTVDDLLALASPELRRPPLPADRDAEDDAPYAATAQGTVWRRPTQNGAVEQLLSNFVARIEEEIVADDGVGERSEVAIAGELAGGVPLPRVVVPLARFAAMEWPVRHWGTRAVVAAGMGTKDRLREAIQRLSPDVPRRRVYEHPGWRELPDREWAFLHAEGALGAEGPVPEVAVELRGAAGRIVLPDPPTGEDLHRAVAASLDLRELAPDAVTAPLFGAVSRAALCAFAPADLSVFLVGPSGARKSELAALAMQHAGAGFDRLHLPAQWAATPNFLERIAFDFKDVPLVVDDFAPTGSQADVARLHATADRVLRGAGNRGGRGRMHADGTLRPDYPPRGLIVGTGEDAPRGHSLRARTVLVEVAPGDVDLVRLTAAQADAREGRLAAAFAGYVQWLAGRVDELKEQLPTQLAAFRDAARGHRAHARTPDAVAHLALGWWAVLRFAADVGALTREEAEAAFARAWAGLGETADRQAGHQAGEAPAQRFVELLGSALAGGYAHVAGEHGEPPPQPAAWGWRAATVGSGEHERTEWRPQGLRAGWVAGEALYLDLEAALAAAQRVGQAVGTPVAVQPKTLAKRLHEGGLLRATEREHGDLKVRRTLEGQRRRVLHLDAAALWPGESGQSGQSDRGANEGTVRREAEPATGRISGPDSALIDPDSGHGIRPNGEEWTGVGRDGRIGRIAARDGQEGAAADADAEVVEWRA
jgi:hypothetical protein